jgi:hypothetical protein
MVDTAAVAREHARAVYPARSKMLDMYAADIASMLADGRQETAELASLPIPHIAVALADAGLRSSCTAYQEWCSRWVQPKFDPSTYEDWCRRSGECESVDEDIPFAALRALRLRRWAREIATPFVSTSSAEQAQKTQSVSCVLLGAAFRWYEQEGRYDPLVQTNIARLGVLR